MKKEFYDTYSSAQQATQELAITTAAEYQQRYKQDPHLPSNPDQVYASEWHNWSTFLGTADRFYPNLAAAQQATRGLAITTKTEYRQRYKQDPHLPARPDQVYADEWHNWSTFWGNPIKELYPNLAAAQQATQELAITTRTEYRQRYKQDPHLPSNPEKFYASEWHNWSTFLGNPIKELYPNLAAAQQATRGLAITTKTEYLQRYKQDPHLPARPDQVYADEWHNWSTFLGNPIKELYPNLAAAQQATQELAITSVAEYQQRYKQDPHLPANPNTFYDSEWQNWLAFLLPKKITNLTVLKHACKILDINNSQQYRLAQKEYKQLPSKPDKKFEDWVDWYDLLDIPRPYPYEQLRSIVLKHKCKTLKDYKKMRIKLNDPQVPSSPEEVYKSTGWTNSYDLFGTTRPYQIKYFAPEWKEWTDTIVEFLKSAKGGDTKAKDLCEFVREYIELNGFETSPLEYLTRGRTNIQPMLELFEKVPVTRKKKWLFSINEFLNWIIANYLILEDIETGEMTPIKGASNPFSHVNFDGELAPQTINETNKLALPYQFVKSSREWILPPSSMLNKTSYSELHHLQRFPADWIPIDDTTLIDSSDPDCVTKIEGGRTFLWLPIYWTYTYALMQLPARGRQIIYCDSGEADTEVADFKNDKVIWKRNRNNLAELTQQQSMISKTKDNDFGVYYTSNKTNFNGEGYAIPFMPLELAYWLIKLRKWQEKYNPITEPTKWLDCTRTNLNEVQRKQKGINSFLFRDYQDNEPGTFGGRLATRLAAALFFSSKEQLASANYAGRSFKECHHQLEQQESIALTPFKSQYTPHSMRVSLINAYAYEFGMPLEVIMKLVGHSSIVMSIYYLKSDKTGANIRERIQLGEKQALSNGADTLRNFVESQRIEECKNQLIANNPDFLQTINNARPASSYLFKDFGICPVGGAFCDEGGAPVAMKANIYHPVNAGYLGEQNCIQCRFFVTGPAFMMGLSALFNEVSLAVNTQSHRYAKLENQLNETVTQIEVLSNQIYQHKLQSEQLTKLEREKQQLQTLRRKLNSEIETRAKKMDLYMSDMNSTHKHLISCQKVINQEKQQDSSKLQLIVPHEFEISFELNDVSGFQQLSEVCENAELYHSCSDELAVTRRSQALDKMLLKNGMNPQFVFLTEEQQLVVGNQMTQLMISRLQSWEKVDRLINGSLVLNDFAESEGFSTSDIKELFANSTPLKLVD
ncbi:integrase [Shewanella canadensis]|uniref:Integrase n=1 Tax=Shewanella canadensis TaxID=271096 RepID=A0A3S0L025_9GAMM|nr:VPA1269 family protein [Shewanella canadensis]RTR38190.1 integrase [Shewanella canadensis]